VDADPEARRQLAHGDLALSNVADRRHAVSEADPLDHRQREWQSARTAKSLSIQFLNDLCIG
jgi:hypothetical protein